MVQQYFKRLCLESSIFQNICPEFLEHLARFQLHIPGSFPIFDFRKTFCKLLDNLAGNVSIFFSFDPSEINTWKANNLIKEQPWNRIPYSTFLLALTRRLEEKSTKTMQGIKSIFRNPETLAFKESFVFGQHCPGGCMTFPIYISITILIFSSTGLISPPKFISPWLDLWDFQDIWFLYNVVFHLVRFVWYYLSLLLHEDNLNYYVSFVVENNLSTSINLQKKLEVFCLEF